MNQYTYNSGEFRVGKARGNRHTTSKIINDTKVSSIAIACSILLLAIITCVFFVVFRDDFSLPTWDFTEWIPTATTTATNKGPILPTDKYYPYATNTNKTKFLADKGGVGLGGLTLSSEYAILINVDDMTTLAHKNADTVIYPASMTKVMTVITALDYIEDLDDVYVLTKQVLKKVPDGASVAALSIYLEEGQKNITVRDLLYGISYMSGADSVVCLLDYFNLTVEEFASLMNKKAREIGLKNTSFGGAIGMDAEENRTTCRDMAAIMAYAMENEYAREFFSGGKHSLDIIEGYSYYHSTLDTLLGRMYTSPSVLLGNYTILAAKSGLEDKAGYCLVSYIQNDSTGEHYVLVTANANRAEWPDAQNTIHDMASKIATIS